MILYHLCTQERFHEKQAFAKANGGQLLISPHNAKWGMSKDSLSNYLHCLPNIVGGVCFTGKSEAVLIRIETSPNILIHQYKGEDSHVDLSKIDPRCDLIHCEYSNKASFQWQEFLLLKADQILHWTADKEILGQDFSEQLCALEVGKIIPSDFFYRDFYAEEQIQIAKLVGHYTGLSRLSSGILQDCQRAFDNAYARIEQKYYPKP